MRGLGGSCRRKRGRSRLLGGEINLLSLRYLELHLDSEVDLTEVKIGDLEYTDRSWFTYQRLSKVA